VFDGVADGKVQPRSRCGSDRYVELFDGGPDNYQTPSARWVVSAAIELLPRHA
jgi:hypothetical protein